ncbi:hypothetical protein DAI43_26030, partial [Achromobacter xylosoxidans]
MDDGRESLSEGKSRRRRAPGRAAAARNQRRGGPGLAAVCRLHLQHPEVPGRHRGIEHQLWTHGDAQAHPAPV